MSGVNFIELYEGITGQSYNKFNDNSAKAASAADEYTCPVCRTTNLMHEEGVIICGKCGTNLGCNIDMCPEWRNDPNNQDMSRCSATTDNIFVESSYGTCIAYTNSKVFSDIRRNMIWHTTPYNERSLRERFEHMSMCCHNFGIKEAVIQYAQTLYHEVLKVLENHPTHKMKRGNNNEGLQAATLYYALQDDGHPRTYKEIAKIFRLDHKYVTDGIKLFAELMNDTHKLKTTKYSDYIERFCNKLSLDTPIKMRVTEIADCANKLGILDNNAPTSIVAGCIYYAIVENAIPLHKNTIAQQCDVSVPTIGKVYSKLLDHSEDL